MKDKSKQQIESVVTEAISSFIREKLGEQPQTITTHIIADTIIVRFRNVLSLAEKRLIQGTAGGELIKELKWRLIEQVKPLFEKLIRDLTGAGVIDVYSDIDLDIGERIGVFTLDRNLEEGPNE